MKTITLDKTDRKILRILQKNARASIKEIASQLYMSSPAISARIAKLEESGVITGYHAQIDPAVLGYSIKAFINLEVDPKQKSEFYSFAEGVENVVECSYVTGEYSMLIEALFEGTEQLDHFVNRLQAFGHTKTLIAFSTAIPQRPVPVPLT
ncbi:MAG: Lrp/AsnC family transcriptional regulator [Lachnospiraceae bacterium]|nr:Lrp/AsnC family transcriptional regulator [Lachnospiraceae bacterium]